MDETENKTTFYGFNDKNDILKPQLANSSIKFKFNISQLNCEF